MPVGQIQLGFPYAAMPDLPPIDQIGAVENRNAGKIFEAAVDEIIIAPDPADAGIGMETGDNGIVDHYKKAILSSELVMREVCFFDICFISSFSAGCFGFRISDLLPRTFFLQ
jgi:hypothetical protein